MDDVSNESKPISKQLEQAYWQLDSILIRLMEEGSDVAKSHVLHAMEKVNRAIVKQDEWERLPG